MAYKHGTYATLKDSKAKYTNTGKPQSSTDQPSAPDQRAAKLGTMKLGTAKLG